VEALPKLVDRETARIHGQFHQTVAATGRLSSTDPNLQNIPVRTPLGRRIRQAFTAQEDASVLLSADYSQIELRILAHLSRDDGLVAAFQAGEDIHAATAARIFDLPVSAVDSEARARAKTVNFGVLYGMGPHRLSREMGIPLAEARAFIEQYFAKMPGVKRYLEENLGRARANGFVTTLSGRRRYLPALQGEDARARAQAERIAANTPIQGSAADLIKRAMIRIDDALRRGRHRTRMILQVHDELLFEGPSAEREKVASIVREAMESAGALIVPLKVDLGHGGNWDEAHG
jgi:DNA polymerase-1